MAGRPSRRATKRLSHQEIADLLEDSDEISESSDSGSNSDFELSNEADTSESSDDEGGGGDEDDEDDPSVMETNEDRGGGDENANYPSYNWVVECTGENNPFPCTENEEIHLLGLSKPISEATIPEIYGLFLTGDIIDYMVKCTNENATNFIMNTTLKRSSRYSQWIDTDKEEMNKFIGLRIWMGLSNFPNIKNYWSKFTITKNELASKITTCMRFENILRFWHFGPNDESQGRLYKIMPLIQRLQENFTAAKTPRKPIVVDESMIKFRGRLSFRQYNPQKAAKYGIKVFKLCDPIGYTYTVQVYQGKGTVNANESLSMPSQVVLNLAEPYLDCGRTLCADNWYTSMELVTSLQERKTQFIGTVRKNRKHLPKEVMNAKLKKGECKSMTEQKTGAIALKWRDKREVHMLSTVYSAKYQTVKTRSGKEVSKPEIVNEYNRIKGGIDIADTLMAYYNPERKTLRWYHKVVDSFLLGTSVINAFLIWNSTRPTGVKKTSLERFRAELAEKDPALNP